MSQTAIRQLPAVEQRVENGPIQFGDDWPGLFIRGDRAAYYAMALTALPKLDDPIAQLTVESLCELLGSCIIGPGGTFVREGLTSATSTPT